METITWSRQRELMTTSEPLRATARPSDDGPILIIGATGKTGRRVLAALTDAGADVRPTSRSSPTYFDWTEPDSWAPALAGARSAYVVPPDVPSDLERFVAEAEAAGLERLVLLSARQPEQGGDGVLLEVEAAVRQGALPTTVLRPSWFSQNFTEGLFVDELAEGVLRLPVGDGREPFVDTADIAAVAVSALIGDGPHDATYDLSGPELLTFDDAVARLARVTGRELRFEPVEVDVWADAASAYLPAPVVELLMNLFTAIREGANEYLSPGVQQVLGRPARSFDDALSGAGLSETTA